MAFILLSLLSYLWEILEGLVASRIVLLIVVSIGSVFLPTFLGWVLTTVLQKTVLHGYPMSFGAIHTSLYFSQVPNEVCERPHAGGSMFASRISSSKTHPKQQRVQHLMEIFLGSRMSSLPSG